jgi:RNA polymerase sigma-70 factor (ECF subfamily)
MSMFERWLGSRGAEEKSDTELHRAALAGSGEAMATLYRRHGSLVYRFTLRMSGDALIAEEVTQEVFLALMRQLARFDPQRASLGTWLCAIARRQLWKHLGRLGEGAPADAEDGSAEIEPPGDSPVMWLIRQEAVEAVRLGVDELPPQFKEVIVLCEFEEMSYEQVALILEIPVGTVRSRLHRAKARLAKLLCADAVSRGGERQ